MDELILDLQTLLSKFIDENNQSKLDQISLSMRIEKLIGQKKALVSQNARLHAEIIDITSGLSSKNKQENIPEETRDYCPDCDILETLETETHPSAPPLLIEEDDLEKCIKTIGRVESLIKEYNEK